MTINGVMIGSVSARLIHNGAKSALYFQDEKTTIAVTRRGKLDGRAKHIELLVSIGPLNFKARKMLARWKRNGTLNNHLGGTFLFYEKKKGRK